MLAEVHLDSSPAAGWREALQHLSQAQNRATSAAKQDLDVLHTFMKEVKWVSLSVHQEQETQYDMAAPKLRRTGRCFARLYCYRHPMQVMPNSVCQCMML